MNGKGPSLRSLNTWNKRVAKFLAILSRALEILQMETDLPTAEVDLNRRLYFCLVQATRELYPRDEISPALDCNNQPDPDDETRAKRENKRPDFQWSYLDRFEPDLRRCSRQFVVECKRLGSPPRSDRVLNTKYVEEGIWRFIALESGYAKGCASAAMVGYWQDMAADDILREVNDAASKHGVSPLGLSREGWRFASISRLEHKCERSFPVSPLLIYHLWADLRRTPNS